ncbi:MAG TPA: SH3 domain-containing protein, partial [Pyrinomonadaceae bacterium]|nr:SH3 domain-containing protein [Pyrinomonadaceae bacterium]
MKLVPLLAAAALSAALLPAPRAGDAGRAPQAGGAARDIRPADTPCDLPAYVADPDPRGLNVRSGPGTPFPVVGVIPHKGGSAVGLTVTGSSGPWVRIKDA